MLRMLFQVSCWWRLFFPRSAGSWGGEWVAGRCSPRAAPWTLCPEPAVSRALRSVPVSLSSQGCRVLPEMLSHCWRLLLCASPTVLLTCFNSLLFRVWLWNLLWWIQISKTCWKISQWESFAWNAFSELCSRNGLSGSFFFLFFLFLPSIAA